MLKMICMHLLMHCEKNLFQWSPIFRFDSVLIRSRFNGPTKGLGRQSASHANLYEKKDFSTPREIKRILRHFEMGEEQRYEIIFLW